MQLASDRFRRLVHHLWIWIGILIAEVEIVQAADGHDMKVAVRDLEAGQHYPDALGFEAGHLRPTDRLSSLGKMRKQARLEVEPVINFLPRYHQRMAWTQRPVRKKDDALFVFPHKSGR